MYLVLFVTLLVLGGDVVCRRHRAAKTPHVQDSITYLFQAQTLARGRLWAPAPPIPRRFPMSFCWWKTARWFGKYPPGYPLVLAVGVLVGQPWLVNPLLAALTIPLFVWVGEAVVWAQHGAAGCRLALASPFSCLCPAVLWRLAQGCFWITLFMFSWARLVALHDDRRCQRVALAGVGGAGVGMTFLTRQVTAVALYSFIICDNLAAAARLAQSGLETVWREAGGAAFVFVAARLPMGGH
ncbi:MAG: hypothetical protein R3E31_07530 [Chloroflexota bacterium]